MTRMDDPLDWNLGKKVRIKAGERAYYDHVDAHHKIAKDQYVNHELSIEFGLFNISAIILR